MKIGRFILYSFLLIMISALGCLISFGKYCHDNYSDIYFAELFSNIGTFSIAVAVPACADAIITGRRGKTTNLLIFIMTTVSILTSAFSIAKSSDVSLRAYIQTAAVIGFSSAFICWLIINTKNPSFYDDTPFNPLGGEIA